MLGVAREVQAQRQHAAGVARVDHAVVPQAGGAEEHVALGVQALLDLVGHAFEHRVVDGHAGAFHLAARDDVHDLGGLRAAHHGGARRGPAEDEARVEPTPAHAVVARAKRAVERDGELGHPGVGHGLDHLGAVLDGAAVFGRRAHHVAGGVLQEDQGRARLVAQLDELRGLGRALRLDGAVVADDADEVAVDAGVSAQRFAAVVGLELQEVGAIHDAGDHLAAVEGLAVVRRDAAHQLFFGIQRRHHVGGGLAHRVPLELVDQLARQRDRVGVVVAQVLAQAGHAGVHLGAAQVLVRGVFADGGLHQRRAGQVDAAAALDQDHVVRQAGQVGAARGAGAVHHRDLRDAHGRHARLVGEALAALHEDVGLVHEVGAAALDQADEGQLVFAGDLLGAQRLLQAHGRDRAAFERRVRRRDQAALARHHADADDGAAAQHALLAVVVVHAEASQGGQFEEGRAAVDQAGHPFARQQLAAFLEFVPLGGRALAHQGFEGAHLVEALLHARGVGAKGVGVGQQGGAQGRHLELDPW